MKTAPHPTLPFTLYFNEDAHQYLIDTEKSQEYWRSVPSVTQFVSHYIPPFDAEKAAKKKAAYSNPPKTPEQILQEWDAKRAHACEMGTRVHANQEAMMNGSQDFQQPADDRERAIMSAGWQAMTDLSAAGWQPLAAEKMVFSMEYRLAGTIDAIFQRGREILIVDWKTNEAIHKRNNFGQHFLPPANALEDCEYNKYMLQLNLYKRILLKDGYLLTMQEPQISLMLVHLTPTGYNALPAADCGIADRLLLDYLTRDWYAEEAPF
jgi:ATP-dependent exoDNAse (exonuclease V) beta subunit